MIPDTAGGAPAAAHRQPDGDAQDDGAPPGSGLALTVLGSGSPFTSRRRASSGYLVWVDGEARLLLDAGGGVFERLGRLGVDVAGLDAVALTHTHIDHSGGLAPVVFAAVMQGRTWPLPVIGPTGRDDQPGCRRFCDLLFGPAGAWSYLHSFDRFAIDAHEVPHDAATPQPVALPATRVPAGSSQTGGQPALQLTAVGVAHGMMPAVAYRVDAAGRSLVVSGDLEGASPALAELARGCDLLVHDQALPRRDLQHGHLHPPPEDTGANAAAGAVGTLVLSHLMPPAERHLDEVVRRVASRFDGRIEVAHDLLTVAA